MLKKEVIQNKPVVMVYSASDGDLLLEEDAVECKSSAPIDKAPPA